MEKITFLKNAQSKGTRVVSPGVDACDTPRHCQLKMIGGNMEWREMQEMFDVRRWRKTGLFDRLLSFNVRLADSRPGGH